MGAECFTCKYKLSRELTPEETAEKKQKYREETGKMFTPSFELEFKCKVSGAIIHQSDKACRYFEPDKTMAHIKTSIQVLAGKYKRELNRRR